MIDRLTDRHAVVIAVFVVAVMMAASILMAWFFRGAIAYGAEPRGTDRWFAEGNTLPEFETFYLVQNTGREKSTVRFEFETEGGKVPSFATDIPAMSRYTLRLRDVVGEGHSGVACHVHSSADVVVERSMYFTYKDRWTGGSISAGQESLRNTFYYAEGTTRDNKTDGKFETWLCLSNPGSLTASVNVTYLLDEQVVQKQYAVAAHSRRTVEVAGDIGGDRDCGVVVHSNLPVACERSMYFNYHDTVEDGSTVVGAPQPETEWYFAEGTTRRGFDEWVTILNLDVNPTMARVRWSSANRTGETEVQIPAHSRRTVNVNKLAGEGLDIAVVVDADKTVVAERSTYADGNGLYGGDSAMGTTVPATTWQFAEGTTRTGFTTYYAILNPNPSPATATMTYRFRDGTSKKKTFIMPGGSRTTVDAADDVAGNLDVAVSIASDLPIVAERPMYFEGRWRGSTVGTGVAR